MNSAIEIAAAVRAGVVSALEVARATLARIEARNGELNAFTQVTRERALREAAEIDAARAAGRSLGPLAGVPYAVKALFDIAGEVTLAGSIVRRATPPARHDAEAIRRLRAAGAVLVGALNMDEFAYGFTTDNTHYGPTRNPHDPSRSAGGSSGGSGAAVAAGLVPIALGTDTNGSVRIPASFCGVCGLRPTLGDLPIEGTVPFAASLDCIGPLAGSAVDLATAYDALLGMRGTIEPRDVSGARVAVLGEYFEQHAGPDARLAVERAAAVLGARGTATLPEAHRARAAAAIITASEGAAVHLDDLRARANDFDPRTRDRFLAGALVPAAWVERAREFARWFRAQALRAFEHADILLAAATPFPAPRIGETAVMLNGATLPAGPSCGLLTQPISLAGWPVAVVPVRRGGRLPLGVQIIGRPGQDVLCLQVAMALDKARVE